MNRVQNSRAVLVFDMGNTRIKWGVWHLGDDFSGLLSDLMGSSDVIGRGVVSSSESSLLALTRQLSSSYEKLEKVLAVNVAGDAIENVLVKCVKQTWAKDVQFLRSSERYSGHERTLVNAYADPAFHGADRWAGLIAASHEFSGALCVISAGTAITIDLLEADGKHLGGRILPSLHTMGKALLADTAEINLSVEKVFDSLDASEPALFANDTQGAVSSGMYYLLAAGLREACLQVIERLSQPATFIVTGGGGEQVIKWLEVPEIKHQEMKYKIEYRPDLILQGVYLAFNEDCVSG